MPHISLVIPVRNRKEYTKNILSELQNQISEIYQNMISIIVIDDGSTDGTTQIISSEFPQVHLIQGNGSLWWTGAIKLGMEYALDQLASDYIIWLNDDIFLREDFIEKVIKICTSPQYHDAVIGGIVCDRTYPHWIVFSGMLNKKLIRNMDHFGAKAEIQVDTLNGNITIIPRHIVDIIGLPDQDRFRHYGGDFEFVLRAKKKGFKVILSSQLQATTDYQVNDVIRYMHPWWQWQLRPNFSQRKEILKGFTNFKSHYNIWHRVNINHFGAKSIPKWKYLVLYIRQVIKVLSSDFWLKGKIESEIKNYCQEQNIPPEITEQILAERSFRGSMSTL